MINSNFFIWQGYCDWNGMEWTMFRIIDIQESPSINQFINQLYSPHIYIVVHIFLSCHYLRWQEISASSNELV